MRYVAFLRGINVGGAHAVRMEPLRAMLVALGMRNVETFIASGNVIFDASGKAVRIERRIEECLERELGFAVPAILRTTDEVAKVAAYKPFRGLGPNHRSEDGPRAARPRHVSQHHDGAKARGEVFPGES